jgi:hypothetical protein
MPLPLVNGGYGDLMPRRPSVLGGQGRSGVATAMERPPTKVVATNRRENRADLDPVDVAQQQWQAHSEPGDRVMSILAP